MTDGLVCESLKPIGEYIRIEGPIAKILDNWRIICIEKIGQDVQVMLADRKDNPDIAELPGNFNMAHPYMLNDGRVGLIVWLNSTMEIDQAVITHEVGHWVLILQGFCGFSNKSAEVHKMIGARLMALLHHAPLYELQKQIGDNPQPVINVLSEEYILYFSQYKETARSVTEHTLIAGDLMINAQEAGRRKLERVLKKKHPNTKRLVQTVVSLRNKYNIFKPEGNRKWGWSLIKELGLGSGWAEVTNEDIIAMLVNMK